MTSFMRMAMATSGAALALALGACGPAGGDAAGNGGDGGAASASGGSAVAAADPCVLSTAEVSAITTDAVKRTETDGSTCYYRSDPDDGVTLKVVRSGGKEEMATMHRVAGVLGGMGAAVADKGGAGADAAAMMKEDKTKAPPLGDEQMWGMNSLLAVRKGDAYVEVTPPIMHDPASHSGYPLIKQDEKRKIATEVAAKALAKL